MGGTGVGHTFMGTYGLFCILLILKRGRGIERVIILLFHLFMHSLVDSSMCPDQGPNLQPWHIRMTL